MTKKILIIVGHQNIKFNSITSLHSSTGASGELEINIRIGNRLSEILRNSGYEVIQSDANVNDDKSITSQDFDLALALHCDADAPNDNGGGMIGSGDKSVDMSWQESLRIKNEMNGVYFKETKIFNKNFVTEGMTKHYIWKYLSSNTPCVLIEMGQATDPHDKVLLANTDLIANAIRDSIKIALPIIENSEEHESGIIPDMEEQIVKLFNDNGLTEGDIRWLIDLKKNQTVPNLEKQVNELQDKNHKLEIQIQELLAEIAEYQKDIVNKQSKLNTANKQIENLNKQIEDITKDRNKYKGYYETALKDQVNKYSAWELFKLSVKKIFKQ